MFSGIFFFNNVFVVYAVDSLVKFAFQVTFKNLCQSQCYHSSVTINSKGLYKGLIEQYG